MWAAFGSNFHWRGVQFTRKLTGSHTVESAFTRGEVPRPHRRLEVSSALTSLRWQLHWERIHIPTFPPLWVHSSVVFWVSTGACTLHHPLILVFPYPVWNLRPPAATPIPSPWPHPVSVDRLPGPVRGTDRTGRVHCVWHIFFIIKKMTGSE